MISSSFPFWKETAKRNEYGLTVNPLNPKWIAEAIEHFLDHFDKRKQMGENGRRAVLEKESTKLLALYEELLGETD